MEKSIRQKIESLAKAFEDASIKFRLANQAMMNFADMYMKHLPSLNECNKNPIIFSAKVEKRL